MKLKWILRLWRWCDAWLGLNDAYQAFKAAADHIEQNDYLRFLPPTQRLLD